MIDISKVKKLKQADLPSSLQMYVEATGGTALVGHFHEFLFVVTQDPDGHTEMSLTSKNPSKRPGDKAIAAFLNNCFRGQPISMSETERPTKRVRHFVLRLRKLDA